MEKKKKRKNPQRRASAKRKRLRTPDMNEALDVVEQVLLRKDSEATRLWNILTALRGPDYHSVGSKSDTIAVRRKAFPKVATAMEKEGKNPPFDNTVTHTVGALFVPEPWTAPPSHNHFHDHANNALYALNYRKVKP